MAPGGSCVVDMPVVQSALAVRMSLMRCRIMSCTSVAVAIAQSAHEPAPEVCTS